MSPAPDDQYSLGEVVRGLAALTLRCEQIATLMETKYVRFDLFEASKQLSETERQQLDARLSKIESRSEWLVRTVGGIVISGMLSLGVLLAKAKTGG